MSILKRTVFFDDTTGVVRFWDWAMVLTTLGTMVEPFRVDARFSTSTPISEFDPTDEICRIDEIRSMPVDQSMLHLSSGPHQLHGGYCHPRDGK
jgi:hypothetical protein